MRERRIMARCAPGSGRSRRTTNRSGWPMPWSPASYAAPPPASRDWAIFRRLCLTAGAKGNLVADAYLAAIAIEAGGEWITLDRDFSRFPGLRWRHPLAEIGRAHV